MTIIFESKIGDKKTIEVKDVRDFTTGESWLGTTGYGVHYEDGTYSLYSNTSWHLVMVRQ